MLDRLLAWLSGETAAAWQAQKVAAQQAKEEADAAISEVHSFSAAVDRHHNGQHPDDWDRASAAMRRRGFPVSDAMRRRYEPR